MLHIFQRRGKTSGKICPNQNNNSSAMHTKVENRRLSNTTILSSFSSSTGKSSDDSTSDSRPSTASLREYGECYKQLGKGSTAVVSICKNKNKLYAIKRFRKRNKHETEKEYMKRLTSEFCISSTFQHENIVETIDLVLDDENRYCTVMEYCPGGDLFYAILAESMTEIELCCCFKQLIRGIAYLHSIGVAHRDLKPENLLLTLDGKLKITDFGVSTVFRCAWEKNARKSSGLVGSEPYIAPEIFEKSDYWGSNADIWSAGIVMYSMWRGGHVWSRAEKKIDHDYRLYLTHAKSQTFPNFKNFDTNFRSVLYKMLDPNPESRITAEGILQDEWVKSILVCKKSIDALNRYHQHTNVTIYGY